MNTHSGKIVASFVGTLAAAIITLWTVLPGWALHPPRLDLSSALLVPLGHLGMRIGFPGWLVFLLACMPIVAAGVGLGYGWIRGRLWRAVGVAATLHTLTVLAAVAAGVDGP